MKSQAERLNPEEIIKKFPIAHLVEGWYFRVEEMSAGAYRVEGTDLYGRRVGGSGHDPDEVLSKCKASAVDINAQRQQPR